jgi:hypothetical protein
MASIIYKEIQYTNFVLNHIIPDLRQSGAIIIEYETQSVLVSITNFDNFINQYKETKTYKYSSLKPGE